MTTYTVIFEVDGLPFKKQIVAEDEMHAEKIATQSFKIIKVQDSKEVLERVKNSKR